MSVKIWVVLLGLFAVVPIFALMKLPPPIEEYPISVQLQVNIETSPTAGILKGVSTGENQSITIPEHQLDLLVRDPHRQMVVVRLTSDTPQMIKEGGTYDGVEILLLSFRQY